MIGKQQTLPGIIREEIRRRLPQGLSAGTASPAYPAVLTGGSGVAAPAQATTDDLATHLADPDAHSGVITEVQAARSTWQTLAAHLQAIWDALSGTAGEVVGARGGYDTLNDRLNAIAGTIPGSMATYVREIVWGSAPATLADFDAANPSTIPPQLSPNGGIVWTAGDNSGCAAYAVAFSMIIDAAAGTTITPTVFSVDDQAIVYIDGVAVATWNVGASVRSVSHTFASSGDHALVILARNTAGNMQLIIPDWFVPGVTWQRAGRV